MTIQVTQATDRVQAAGNGLDFIGDDEILTIASKVLIAASSSTNTGVHSLYLNSSLINYGEIVGGTNGEGVGLTKGNGNISNMPGSFIYDSYIGALMDGDGSQTATNFGTIIGASYVGMYFSGPSSSSIFLNNHGYILGGVYGVRINSGLAGGTIQNSGVIRSDQDGISIGTGPNLTTHIINEATGIINGTNSAIYMFIGQLSLVNHGKIIHDIMNSTGYPDIITNTGKILGNVHLAGGNDSFNGNGGSSGHVFGEAGNDHLFGGAHGDLLHGGDNNDTLTGRLGADRFFFDTLPNAVTNVDTITDFSPAQHDKIVVSETYFHDLGALGVLGAGHFHVGGPVNANAQIDYHPGNGFLFYDQDGNGSTYAPIHFATLGVAGHPHPVIHNTDFIVIA